MVRRRRDEADALGGAARRGDVAGDLGARQLAALAGLGALRHLDLQLLRVGEVLHRHAEAARGDLPRWRARAGTTTYAARPSNGGHMIATSSHALRGTSHQSSDEKTTAARGAESRGKKDREQKKTRGENKYIQRTEEELKKAGIISEEPHLFSKTKTKAREQKSRTIFQNKASIKREDENNDHRITTEE